MVAFAVVQSGSHSSCISSKSTRRAAYELQILGQNIMKLRHKRLNLHAYKVQLVQAFQPNDCSKCTEFATEILDRISIDNSYLNRICVRMNRRFMVCKS